MQSLYPIISGVLLALAFPKANLWWLAWVALVPFFFALKKANGWQGALLCGLAFGVFFFGINLFWVTSLTRFVGWWAVLGWLGLVILQTLFVLLFSIVYFQISKFRSSFPDFMALPLLWTAIEWLRSLGPFGVTAGGLAYSQARFLPLIQIAYLASVYAVSFLIAMANAALAELWEDRGQWAASALVLVIVAIVCAYGTIVIRSPLPRSLPRIALIQSSIDQLDKMDPAQVPKVFAIHEQLTLQAAKEKPDIIVWPETALFTYLLSDQTYLPRVKRLAVQTRSWLIIGTPHYTDGKIYNSMVSISPSGEIVSRYDKERLVPFGEYLPFKPLLYPLLKGTGYFQRDFSSNPRAQLVAAGRYKIAPAICFESTFPDLIGLRAAGGADLILTITNDAWFGDSAAPYAHLDAGIFRAIENRKYFVQAGNNGISAVIDPYGRILGRSKLNERGVLNFKLR